MRKIREVLRLRLGQEMKARDVATACGLGCTTVLEYEYRAKAASLGWPPPAELSDSALETLLFPPPAPKDADRAMPDWSHIRSELAKKGTTMTLLWQEYLQANPTGYRCCRFIAWSENGKGEVIRRCPVLPSGGDSICSRGS